MVREKGLYLKNGERPVLKEGQQYWQVTETNGMPQVRPLNPGDPITEMVIDQHRHIVLRKSQIGLIVAKPNVPVVGYRIVEAFVNYAINEMREWEGKNGHGNLGNYLRPHFRRDITDPAPNVAPEVQYADVLARVSSACSTLWASIRDNLFSEDDSEYRHYCVSRNGRDVIITQHEDYRVEEYERLKDSGELAFLKQFLASPDGADAYAKWMEHEKAFGDWEKDHVKETTIEARKQRIRTQTGVGRAVAKHERN